MRYKMVQLIRLAEIIILALSMHYSLSAQFDVAKGAQKPAFWEESRFGMFVHWGLYSIPAWHEQHQYRLGVPRVEYEKQMHEFNPVYFNPDAWLDLMEAAGMKYICITTKHIDGFCMWDTEQTEYKITNTPYGRDILGMLAEACHRRNMHL